MAPPPYDGSLRVRISSLNYPFRATQRLRVLDRIYLLLQSQPHPAPLLLDFLFEAGPALGLVYLALRYPLYRLLYRLLLLPYDIPLSAFHLGVLR